MDEKKIRNVQALLKFTYVLIPVVAGVDKFTNLLVYWPQYLHPSVAAMLPISVDVFMRILGIIEIIAGILVFVRTKIGSYIVCIWLVLISLNLLATGNYLDVAVRDFAMAVGAFALAKLTEAGVVEVTEENLA
ncbi:MAG: hypothetical protein ACTHJ8_05710 [Mucilaginibacter sp.]